MISQLKLKSYLILTALAVLIFPSSGYAVVLGYIPNSMDNNLSVINTEDSSATDIIGPLGEVPFGVATAPAGDFIYVTNKSSNTVSQINSMTGTVLTHTVGAGPVGIAVSPDGTSVYVANQDGYLSVLDTNNSSIESVQIGSSLFGLALDPDQEAIYITDDTDNVVYEIREQDLSVRTSFAVGTAPKGIAVAQSGQYVVVANSGDDTVSIINVDAKSVSEPIIVGSNPFGVAITHDDQYAYVTNSADDSVSKVNIADFSVTAIELAPDSSPADEPQGLSVSPFGEALYVVNNNSDSIKVITIADDTVRETLFEVGRAPVALGTFFFSETPLNLAATLVGDTAIDLSWSNNSASTTGFTIERRKYTTGVFSEIASVEADVTTFSDENLDYFANYYYRVKAENDTGSTRYSNIDFAQTAEEPVDNAGCFITAAVNGSYGHPYSMAQPQLRNSHLLRHKLGTSFMAVYRYYSGPVADILSTSLAIKTFSGIGSAPLVGFCWIAVNYGLGAACILFAIMAVLSLMVTGLIIRSR